VVLYLPNEIIPNRARRGRAPTGKLVSDAPFKDPVGARPRRAPKRNDFIRDALVVPAESPEYWEVPKRDSSPSARNDNFA